MSGLLVDMEFFKRVVWLHVSIRVYSKEFLARVLASMKKIFIVHEF